MYKDAINLIKKFESFKENIYLCPAGFKTIGYGHVIKKDENFTSITIEQAEELLLKDVQRIINFLHKNIDFQISKKQFNALISFCYNIGTGAFFASTLRRKINRGDVLEASEEFSKWIYAGGQKLLGLIIRRHAEKSLFLS